MEFNTEDKGKCTIFIYIFLKIKLINILNKSFDRYVEGDRESSQKRGYWIMFYSAKMFFRQKWDFSKN